AAATDRAQADPPPRTGAAVPARARTSPRAARGTCGSRTRTAAQDRQVPAGSAPKDSRSSEIRIEAAGLDSREAATRREPENYSMAAGRCNGPAWTATSWKSAMPRPDRELRRCRRRVARAVSAAALDIRRHIGPDTHRGCRAARPAAARVRAGAARIACPDDGDFSSGDVDASSRTAMDLRCVSAFARNGHACERTGHCGRAGGARGRGPTLRGHGGARHRYDANAL